MRTEAEIRKVLEHEPLDGKDKAYKEALKWVLNEPKSKFKVGDKVLFNYYPGEQNYWVGMGTVVNIIHRFDDAVWYSVLGGPDQTTGSFLERELLPIPEPPKGILLFPKGYVATWEPATVSYRVTGDEDCYGDWHDLLETYGYEYEVLKESV